MLSPVLALVAAVLVSVLMQAIHLVRSTTGTLLPAIAVFVTVVLLLLRRTSRLVEPLVKEAEKHVMGGRVDMGIKTLEAGLRWGLWHPLVPGQLRSMIGTLYFDTGKLDLAEENLARAVRWPWNTKALLGVVHFKKRNQAGMVKAFETAVGVGKKEGLAWTLYAHCQLSCGNKDAVRWSSTTIPRKWLCASALSIMTWIKEFPDMSYGVRSRNRPPQSRNN